MATTSFLAARANLPQRALPLESLSLACRTANKPLGRPSQSSGADAGIFALVCVRVYLMCGENATQQQRNVRPLSLSLSTYLAD